MGKPLKVCPRRSRYGSRPRREQRSDPIVAVFHCHRREFGHPFTTDQGWYIKT
jgi:hypothetical protein